VVPKATVKDAKPASQAEPLTNSETKVSAETQVSREPTPTDGSSVTTAEANGAETAQEKAQPVPAPAPVKQKPSSWAGLFNKGQAAGAGPVASGQADTNGAAAEGANVAPNGPSSFTPSIKASLGEALQAYRVGKPEKISFLEPRGLINNGNMCYMNSVSL
jgi:ubiquitin carboxyl-terminal hydrolase 10